MTKVRQAERLLERNPLPEKPFEPWELRLELRSSGRVSAPAARLDGAVVARGTTTVGPLHLEVQPGERVAVTGRNGSGKTTLLRALLGELELTSGTRALGRGAVPGVITQERRSYTSGEPLLEAFIRATGLTPVDARTLLAKFGLGADHVSRSCATLSPGRAHPGASRGAAGGRASTCSSSTSRPTTSISRRSSSSSRRWRATTARFSSCRTTDASSRRSPRRGR